MDLAMKGIQCYTIGCTIRNFLSKEKNIILWVLIIGVICVSIYHYERRKYNVEKILRGQDAIDRILVSQDSFVNSPKREGFMKSINPECFTAHPGREGFAKVKIGANAYKIHEDLENPIEAAKTMDRLNSVALKLIDHMYKKYIDDPTGVATIAEDYAAMVIKGIKATKTNFRTANMEENIPERSGGDTSYVIDKGDVFAMCLRDPKNGNKIDPKFNDLTFVLVHELAHLFTSTFGHDTLFWNNFKFMLQEAVEAGLYNPVDYKKNGSPYCGIVISYSPLYDPKLVEYRNVKIDSGT